MKSVLIALTLLPSAALATCPPVPERSERHTQLMAQVAEATNETRARELNDQLWGIWATAPDETAQELLRRGMERRAGYDFVGAIKDFEALIAYCPQYAEGYNQRAFAHFLQGDYEESLLDLDRSLELLPDHIGAASGRALVLLQLGQNEEGQRALRYALTLNPWLPERNRLEPLEAPQHEIEL